MCMCNIHYARRARRPPLSYYRIEKANSKSTITYWTLDMCFFVGVGDIPFYVDVFHMCPEYIRYPAIDLCNFYGDMCN